MFVRATFLVLRERARDDGSDGGRSGAIVVVQRFDGALNLNLHRYALVLDGVSARADERALASHPIRRVTSLDVEEALAEGDGRRGRGRGGRCTDAKAPSLAGLAAASVHGLTAVGP